MSARVLVVDDILPNVKLLEAKLMGEYYDVITASNGEEALAKVESESPDIVLLDVMMPGMDGFEVCRRIKKNPDTAHIPVVMVTALTDTADRVMGLEAGADDFLSKPLDDIALMARVRSLVRLKMTIDEWLARENTASQLGVIDGGATVMSEPVENARILLIDDQTFEHEKFRSAVDVDKDTLVIVESGAEAMKLLAEGEKFDLITVSLNLANEDGLRLCSHLRTGENTRNTPILMVATSDDMPRVANGLEIGAHDYILRPVDRNELIARIRTQIRRKRFQERLKSSYEISLSMALTDPLTGLFNRRYLEVHLKKLLKKNETSEKELGVLMIDIDHFKRVNDTYGHNVGDIVLKEVASRLTGNLRGFDLVARMGGEEFIAILPDVSEERAIFIAERLRVAVEEKPFVYSDTQEPLNVTVSVGGAIIESREQVLEDVIERADKALYEAKESGRNATVFENIGKIDPDEFIQKERDFS